MTFEKRDCTIITQKGGSFYEHQVYSLKGRLFVRIGAAYVGIGKRGLSNGRETIEVAELPFATEYNALGYMVEASQ